MMVMPVVISALGTVRKDLEKKLRGLKNSGRIEIIQTTALLREGRMLRIPKDQRRLADIQTLVKNHQHTLVGKTCEA